MRNDRLQKLAQIHKLTRMAEDAELARVREAAAARNVTLAALARLDAGGLVDPRDVAAQCARARHAIWQERQRRLLNMRLARETATWLELREDAARAVGRNQTVGQLMKKHRKP